jgi:hypothetical protein
MPTTATLNDAGREMRERTDTDSALADIGIVEPDE